MSRTRDGVIFTQRYSDCWIPACAGMTAYSGNDGIYVLLWIPACAGMTAYSGNDGLQRE
jgi:hypothetical protein